MVNEESKPDDINIDDATARLDALREALVDKALVRFHTDVELAMQGHVMMVISFTPVHGDNEAVHFHKEDTRVLFTHGALPEITKHLLEATEKVIERELPEMERKLKAALEYNKHVETQAAELAKRFMGGEERKPN